MVNGFWLDKIIAREKGDNIIASSEIQNGTL